MNEKHIDRWYWAYALTFLAIGLWCAAKAVGAL